jgi:hypothetical protein
MQRQERNRGPFAQQRLVWRLARRAKSPHSGAINAERSMEVSIQGLDGGVRSRMRTRLH